jgi:HAD superfamily hydrolase (TIGR01484 family)
MKPLATMPAAEAQNLMGLLFDLDDTVLDHGRLYPATLEALEALSNAGLVLVGLTGRPLSWAQVLVRQWPIAGMVSENGGVAIHQRNGALELHDRLSASARAARRSALATLAAQIEERWPELSQSDGGLGRLSDVAFDVAEHVSIDPKTVAAVVDFAERAGARTSISSVHLHVTFDSDDKASGALRFLNLTQGLDATLSCQRYAFIGDSGNDAAAFAAFQTTIAVQNLQGRFTLNPRYMTTLPRGQGFAEAARTLLALRAQGLAEASKSAH